MSSKTETLTSTAFNETECRCNIEGSPLVGCGTHGDEHSIMVRNLARAVSALVDISTEELAANILLDLNETGGAWKQWTAQDLATFIAHHVSKGARLRAEQSIKQ